MSKTWTFHGGIHPDENKHQSVQSPIAFAGIPDELVLPLSQHIGTASVPVVAEGDRVLKGQLIAEAGGFVSVPLHAPTSGTVTNIEERIIAHPSGYTAPCIVIASDGRDEWQDHQGCTDYTAVSRSELVAMIRAAGIAGMGGAGFPSAVKLSPPPGRHIHTLIINGTECEPYITADDMLMRERADRIIAGTNILRHILQPARTLIGVEDNKPEAIAALHAMGIKTAMITGDNRRTAEAIARQAGIDDVVAEVLPDQKVEQVQALRRKYGRVAMIGDAPALVSADVGVAIGTGTDIAIEAADVTLVSGNLLTLVSAVRLSRATFRKIQQNLFWAFFYNLLAIPMAVMGLLHPVIAELAMATSSITVVSNANLLKKVKI